MPLQTAFSPQQAARIAGAAYLITNATAEFNLFFVLPRLFVVGDVARTAGNIVAHAQLYRVAILMDLLTIAGVVILNVALYELLSPVHRSLARLAAFWRLVESAVYAGIIVANFLVLAVLSDADYLQPFQPAQLHAFVRLLSMGKLSGFLIAMLFLCLGSWIYCYLLFISRYIPRVLAFSGIVASTLGALYILARFLFPESINAATAVVMALPIIALVLLGLVLVPIFSFEFTIGFWLLLKGVRVGESNETT